LLQLAASQHRLCTLLHSE